MPTRRSAALRDETDTLVAAAKRLSPDDDATFGAAWPRLDDTARHRLHDAIERLDPKHPWLNRMAAPDRLIERDGERVRLREPTLDDAPTVDAWRGDPRMIGEFNDFGLPKGRSLAENLAHGKRMVGPERGQLLVVRKADDVPIGDVSWHTVSYGPGERSRAFNIGVALIPEGRGQGFGSEAQRLLVELLFDLYDIERVEASTDIDNVAEQRSLEKAGFTREGVLRRAQFRAGTHHDLVSYSFVREDLDVSTAS